jgi:hypothetical protein
MMTLQESVQSKILQKWVESFPHACPFYDVTID